jgi:hypothetical protein
VHRAKGKIADHRMSRTPGADRLHLDSDLGRPRTVVFQIAFHPVCQCNLPNDAAALSVAFPIVSACPNVLAVGTALAIEDLNPPGVGRASARGSLAISGSPRRPRGRARAGRVGSADLLERGLALVHPRILHPCFRERNGAREQIRNSSPRRYEQAGPEGPACSVAHVSRALRPRGGFVR